MATKGYLMLLGGMREIERILKERMHEDKETIEECGVVVLVESMADQIDELKEELKALQNARPVEGKAEAGDVPLAIEMHALAIHLRDIGAPGESQDLHAMADRVQFTRPVPAASTEGLREALEAVLEYRRYEWSEMGSQFERNLVAKIDVALRGEEGK